jgi:uncharacterized protein (TIGR02453 family)
MTFDGFGEHAVDFYDGLTADNSKAFWDRNRATYDGDVAGPMTELLAELEPEFGAGKVFRPYRDVRFSRDKTPYKTHCGGVVEAGRGGGAYYVQLSSDGLLAGGGSYHMAPDQLARFRTAVAEDGRGEEFRKILAALEDQGWEIRGERLKTRPKGIPAEHPRLDLLRYTSVYAGQSWEPDDVLHERETLVRVRTAWRQVRSFNEWCADHIGVTTRMR